MGGMGQGDEWGQLRDEFAAWFATPKRLRRQLNLPRTEREFADMKGVSERTLRRWKQREDFGPLVETHRSRVLGALDGAAVAPNVGVSRPRTFGEVRDDEDPWESAPTVEDDPAFEPGVGRHEFLYRQAKDDVFQRASEGSSQAIELMMKYWGREMLEKEQAEQDLFADMTDEELLNEVVSLAGEEQVARTLASRAG